MSSKSWIKASSAAQYRNQVETLFHNAVPYRVSQILPKDGLIILRDCDDDFELNAPKILAIKEGITTFTPAIQDIKDLSFGDKIFVNKYQSTKKLSSASNILFEIKDGRYIFKLDGIAVLASHDSSLIRCYDLSYISRIDNSKKYWITDRMKFDHRFLANDEIDEIPKESRKIGTRLRCEYLKFPKNSFHHPPSSLRIVPSVIKACRLPISRKSREEDVLISVAHVEQLENINDLSNDLVCLYSCLFCIFTKDKIETIENTIMNWKISESGYAQVTYSNETLFDGDPSHNYANSLFTRSSIAILKRHTSEGEKEELKEIHVKINKAIFKKTKITIGFKVKIDEVMKEWNLKCIRDLVSGKYTLEPSDIFAHWRPFIDKLVENENYLRTIFRNSESPRATIMEAFLPNEKSNMRFTKLPFAFEEAKRDSKLQLDQLPYAHKIARDEIARRKPIVIIDGAAQTGKTTLNTYIVPDILRRNLVKELYGTINSLALVSPSNTLKTQLELIEKSAGYCRIEKDVRMLNLIDLDDSGRGSFLNVLERTLKDYFPTDEDKVKLKAGIALVKTKFCAFHHENTTGYERDIIVTNLSKDEKKALTESAEAYVDLITSKELLIFQDAMEAIFIYYRPNFVIASNQTFISFLPSMNTYISHILVNEAGRSPFIEVLNMVAEIPKLEQLILNGDITQYPYYHRVHLDPRPECYDNSMKMINLASSELSYIQLNKIFGMNRGIVEALNQIFYPGRNLIPLYVPESYEYQFKDLELLRDFKIPISFHNIDKADVYVPPTTRKNYYQSFIAMKLIRKLLKIKNFRSEKILVLCNYSAEKEMMQEKLKNIGLDKMVKVKCVDNSLGEHSDIVIYITTRAIDEKKYEDAEYYNTLLFEGSYELGEVRDNFHYVFERQRIQTAISRARKSVFIIGSRFLLDNCSEWTTLIEMTSANRFSHPDAIEQVKNERENEFQ